MADDELQALENLVLSQNPALINSLPALTPLKPYLTGLSLLTSNPTSSKFTELLKSLETNSQLHDRLQLRQWIKAYEKTTDPEFLEKINTHYFNYTFDYPPPKDFNSLESSHLSSIFVPHFPDISKAESDLATYRNLEYNQTFRLNLENSSDDVFACELENDELWKCKGLPKRFAEIYKKSEEFSEDECFTSMSLEQIEEIAENLPKIWKNEDFVWHWMNKKYLYSLESMNDSQKYEYMKMVAAEICTKSNLLSHFKFLVLTYLLTLEKSLGKCEDSWFLRFLSYYQGQFSSKPVNKSKPASENNFYNLFEIKCPIKDYDSILKYYLSTLFFSNPDFLSKVKDSLNSKFVKELYFEALALRGEPLDTIPKKYLPLNLVESIELEPCLDNPKNFTRTEAVRFSMNRKNIQKLYVKVIELNPRNYFLKNLKKISKKIEIDGLVAQTEHSFEYSEPSHKRVRTDFYFPELNDKVGVFVIEFFGNGRHSRVIIKKGSLRYISEATATGHKVYILDEDCKLCTKGAGVYLDLRFYQANEETGQINLPFARDSSEKNIILTDGIIYELACEFKHLTENYILDAKFLVNEQQMIAGSNVSVLMKLYLMLNGVEIHPLFFNEISVVIKTINAEGITSSKIIKNPAIPKDGNAFELPFQVPFQLTKVEFEVYCTGKNLDGEEVKLNLEHNILVNCSLDSLQILNILLVKFAEGFALQVKGRNGEAIIKQRIDVEAKHLFWKEKYRKALITDDLGQIYLGNLENIHKIRAYVVEDNKDSQFYEWNILKLRDYIKYPELISICSGEELTLPINLESDEQNIENLLWFMLKDDDHKVIQNKISSVKLDTKTSLIHFTKLEAGEYFLEFKRNQKIRICVYDGVHFQNNWIITENYIYMVTNDYLTLGITSTEVQEAALEVKLSGNLDMKPKVLALYFNFLTDEMVKIPELLNEKHIYFDAYSSYFPECVNIYLPSKNLDNESQYVLNRKLMARFVGNSLPKPRMALKRQFVIDVNEEDVRENKLNPTKTSTRGGGCRTKQTARKTCGNGKYNSGAVKGYLTSFDFLSSPAIFLQLPITSPDLLLPKLKNYTNVLIVVYNNHQYSYKIMQLDSYVLSKDIRFKNSAIDSIETYKSVVLKPDQTFTLKNFSSSSIQIIDSLPKLFNLTLQISNFEDTSKVLREWHFLAQWKTLNFDEKKRIYDKYASHELNFFIFKRDYEFFINIVKPFLMCKVNKDIPDKYLCGICITEYANFKFSSRLNCFEMSLVVDQLKENNLEHAQRMSRIIYDIADSEKIQPAEKAKRIKAALFINCSSTETGNFNENKNSEGENDDEEPTKRKFLGKGLGKTGAFKRFRMSSRNSDKDDDEENEREDNSEESNEEESNDEGDSSEDEMNDSSGKLPKYYKKLGDIKQYCESYYYNCPKKLNALFFAELSKSFLLQQTWLSESVLYSVSSLTEQILLLSYASLPDEFQNFMPSINEDTYQLTASSDMLIFYKELTACPKHFNPSISLYSNYYEITGSKDFNRKVKQFLKETVYKCHLIITNSSDRDLNLSVFNQIPEGSIACKPCQSSKTQFIKLKSCATISIEFTFYFPISGNYLHYPGNVAENEVIIANSELNTIVVLDRYKGDELSSFKEFALAQRKDLILEFFSTQNLLSQECEYDINHIGWMLLDKEFWQQSVNILRHRFICDELIWKFGFFHNDKETIAEVLNESNEIREDIGSYFTSDLISTSVVNFNYAEFDPVVNSRVYRIGNQKRITNKSLRNVWRKLLVILAEKGSLDNKDRIYLCQYLIYQDRYSEAIELYKQIDLRPSEGILEPNEIQIQFDYLTCYLNPEASQSIAELYKNYPILTWNTYFKAVVELVNNIEPTDSAVSAAAHYEPTLNFQIIDNCIEIVYENLKKCLIRIYEIDLEVLFSKSPFLIQGAQSFSYVKANIEISVNLKQNPQRVSLEEHKGKNLWIEIDYKTYCAAKSHFSNLLLVNCIERFGIVKVMGTNRKPRPAAYVKTYAMLKSGQIEFYKDGYTDIQGKFDYVSLNIDKLDSIKKFAILIVDDELGSSVQEVLPPPQ